MLQALVFRIATVFRLESTLQEFSVPKSEILSELSGQHVAIVGNSRALSATSQGSKIDAADVVIRINRAPMPSATSHGSKTDWLALATSLTPEEHQNLAPHRTLWMSLKRKRLPLWIANLPGFYLHPLNEWQLLKNHLQNPPSTGAMIIDLVAGSDATEINLFGFDFFASKSLSGRREASQVPHDFLTEEKFVSGLIVDDRRITLHK